MPIKTKLALFIFILTFQFSSCSTNQDLERWTTQAQQVSIIRDEYGVPHIYGKTDADCVFGLMYAQCEDDFKRVEENYLTMLGRTSETKGEKNLFDDLLIRLTIDSADARKDYELAPEWMKKLLQAYADGINYYLHKHPEVKPQVITRFEPWFPLMYTDGSISAIQTGGLSAGDLEDFYNAKDIVKDISQRMLEEDKLIGSNGFSIAPSKSKTGNALFLINPHVTFYFRPEVHMQSEEGLHVYGAVTWGQFFVYQGFNEKLGFMHTSSSADAADLYLENVTKGNDGKYYYSYDGALKPVEEKKINIRYLDNGTMKTRTFTTYATHHGPVMARMDGKWLSLRTMNRSLNGLLQSWQRIKASSLDAFQKNLELRANLSNNTVYADGDGNIAYWHGNYMPIRDKSYNWDFPVDGSTSSTEWEGMHAVKELVHTINPANGWIQNTNNTPYSVSGEMSPRPSDYPSYMAPDGENFRGLNAVRILNKINKIDLDELIQLAYEPRLTAFDTSLPILFNAHEKIRSSDPELFNILADPVRSLRSWDKNSSGSSVATTLAIHWAEKMNNLLRSEDPEMFADFITRYGQALRKASPEQLLRPLKEVVDTLVAHHGTWEVPWGDINRMQRVRSSIEAYHTDTATSIPVGRAASTWGQLASYVSRYFPGTHKRYGTGGNSFVCVVEFGNKVKAKSILAGGQSGDPSSPHFFDQSKMYAEGKFKDVYFYKDDVLKHAKKTYHPGE
jgi:acyl-homoserine lactone acylase PvdQ